MTDASAPQNVGEARRCSPEDLVFLAWLLAECLEMTPRKRLRRLQAIEGILEGWAAAPVNIKHPESADNAARALGLFQRKMLPKLISP